MTGKILVATTSHDVKGETGKPTGAYLSEIAHPYGVFAAAGLEIQLVSAKGGTIPLDGVEDADQESQRFLAEHKSELQTSQSPGQVRAKDYDAIFFAGGHGAMWDLPNDAAFARLTRDVYEQGGVVGAVCHGPAALVNVTLSDGSYLVDGKSVSAFTNEEERAVGLADVVPFLLADQLEARGATHVPAPMWQPQVVESERVVTGQNPASAKGVAEAMVALMKRLPSR